jgi:hypothetical protein
VLDVWNFGATQTDLLGYIVYATISVNLIHSP